ncbi:MAG: GNAT family N-acetyltransferase [Acidobacteriota bacterium]
MADAQVVVNSEDAASQEAQLLIAEFTQELKNRYGDEGPKPWSAEAARQARSAFLVARLDGKAVGTIALGPFEGDEAGVAEAGHLYVRPEARGRKLSYELLRKAEEKAAALGYHTVRLVTGLREPEAIHLFVKCSYNRIPRYGKYAQRPLSACFEKKLG